MQTLSDLGYIDGVVAGRKFASNPDRTLTIDERREQLIAAEYSDNYIQGFCMTAILETKKVA